VHIPFGEFNRVFTPKAGYIDGIYPLLLLVLRWDIIIHRTTTFNPGNIKL